MTININDLTIGQARELASMFGDNPPAPVNIAAGPMRPVLACTDKRGVFFGYTDDPLADPLTLKDARMCIYWSSNIGGVQGLAESGPFDAVKSGEGSRIAAKSNAILKGITAVFEVTDAAAGVWVDAPIYGRSK